MNKNMLVVISILCCGITFSQELPGLGVYVGGIYGGAGGPASQGIPGNNAVIGCTTSTGGGGGGAVGM